jgi:hypothetical protein
MHRYLFVVYEGLLKQNTSTSSKISNDSYTDLYTKNIMWI